MSLYLKTKEELIIEVEKLQQENISLRKSYIDDITELRRAEELLLEGNQQLKDILNNTVDVIWSSTWPDFKVLFLSSSAEKVFGRPLKEFYENKFAWKEIVHPDDRFLSEEALELLVKNGTTSRECRIIHPDGHISWIYEKSELSFDENNNPVRIFGIASDITERKTAELELLKLRNAIDKSGEVIFITDNDGIFTFVNPGFTDTYGYTPEEVIGKETPRILKSGVLSDEVYNLFWQNLLQGKEVKGEIKNKRKDGTIIEIEGSANAFFDEKNNIIGFLGIQRDITGRKNAEAIFRDIIEKNPMSIQILDMEGYTTQTNPAFRKLFGAAPPSDYSITNDPQLLQQGFRELFERITKGEVVFFPDSYFNVNNVDPSFPDAPCWIRAIGFTINDLRGNPERIILMHENITDRKLAEVEILRAKERAEESDLLKSAFLANMSHEIRTPMNGILGFAGLLKEPELSGDLQKKYIEIIEKSGHRMLNIINDIVDISKIESGQMKVVVSETNVNDQMEFLFNFFKLEAQNKGIQLSFKNGLPYNKSIIKTDKEKLYAILTNIIKNAIKYSDKGFIEFGYVLKTTNKVADGGFLSRDDESRNIQMEFFIKDSGIGIPEDRIHAIFDRFVQADIADKRAFQGAGLGLSISKAYVEMLHGKIWVDSKEGEGSTFYFTVPYITELEDKLVLNHIVSDDFATNPEKKLKVLIAEDDETSELLISMIIKDICNKIIKVRTGTEAVKACRDNPDIDLILMDLQMPEMNGDEATSQIRHFNKDIVIIAQTAYGLTGDREMAIKAGCNDYISKPINKSELLELLRKHFDK